MVTNSTQRDKDTTDSSYWASEQHPAYTQLGLGWHAFSSSLPCSSFSRPEAVSLFSGALQAPLLFQGNAWQTCSAARRHKARVPFPAWAELRSPRKNVCDTAYLLRIHDALPGCSWYSFRQQACGPLHPQGPGRKMEVVTPKQLSSGWLRANCALGHFICLCSHLCIYFSLFLFWPCPVACGILVPQPGIEPTHSAVETQIFFFFFFLSRRNDLLLLAASKENTFPKQSP